MSKRTGYQVKITGFIVASPTDMEAMRAAIIKIDAVSWSGWLSPTDTSSPIFSMVNLGVDGCCFRLW